MKTQVMSPEEPPRHSIVWVDKVSRACGMNPSNDVNMASLVLQGGSPCHSIAWEDRVLQACGTTLLKDA